MDGDNLLRELASIHRQAMYALAYDIQTLNFKKELLTPSLHATGNSARGEKIGAFMIAD